VAVIFMDGMQYTSVREAGFDDAERCEGRGISGESWIFRVRYGDGHKMGDRLVGPANGRADLFPVGSLDGASPQFLELPPGETNHLDEDILPPGEGGIGRERLGDL
jgi:hypothetical protein